MAAHETSFAKGLRVLGVLIDFGPMRIEAVVEKVGLPASSVYRYARDLVAAGILENDDGVYCPSERLAQLSRVTSRTDRLTRFGLPVLTKLARDSGETAMLTVRVGRSALVLCRVESEHAIRLSFQRGALRVLYAGASAKVLLAYAPRPIVDTVLKSPMPQYDTGDIPTSEVLRNQIAAVRAKGYAVTHGEVDRFAVGIATPVFCQSKFVCGLSVAGPASRIDQTSTQRILRQVKLAADELGNALETDIETPSDARPDREPSSRKTKAKR